MTARILKHYRREPEATFKNTTQEITRKYVETVEVFWIKEAQRNMKNDIKQDTYRCLCPRLRDDGIYVISGMLKNGLQQGRYTPTISASICSTLLQVHSC